MSEVKVNKVSPRSGTTLTIGDSGDTTNIVGTLNNNGSALLSLANGVDNRVITSSSATALNGEANLTFDGSTLGVNGAAIFNEGGADKDFRVESDGNANMLLVDGGTNRVGIGTTVAIATLNVLADSGSQGIDVLGRSSDNRSRIQLSSNNGTTTYSQWDYNGTTVELKAVANVPLVFRTNNTERVRIHTNGVMSAVNGIALGVGTASTASNVLNDYEEGTFTPTMSASGSGSVSTTSATGNYVKIGGMVSCWWIIDANLSGKNGTYTFSGFPFNSEDIGDHNHRYSGVTSFQRSTGTTIPLMIQFADATSVVIYKDTSGNSWSSNETTASDFAIRCAINYRTAS